MSVDFALYCKSYRKDLLRVKRLLESLRKHNIESIPFYISTPEADHEALIDLLGEGNDYQWIDVITQSALNNVAVINAPDIDQPIDGDQDSRETESKCDARALEE